jgi:tRNA dimethylallyltransferase
VLVGPTASGKSELAVAAAARLGDTEIVSLDAMQVYRGMDIGTDKVPPPARAGIPHHGIDLADPWEEYSVARHRAAIDAALADLAARGRRALLVGGTGLVTRAVVDALAIPGHDPLVRARIEAEASVAGEAALRQRLAALDPAAAARIEPGNTRRVIRALEVIELTGRPFSASGSGLDVYPEPALPVRIVGLWPSLATLARRIHHRVGAMRAAGLVEEVERLAADPRGWSRTARQAIGYRELDAWRRGGLGSVDEAFDRIERRTRALARRQRRWFRRDPRIAWVAGDAPARLLLDLVLAAWCGDHGRDRRRDHQET